MRIIVRLLLLWVAICMPPASWAASSQYDALYVFGDSLSDNGNDLILTRTQGISPAIPPSESPNRTYYKGRFSNGPVAVEHFWRILQNDSSATLAPFMSRQGLALSGAVNFAFGGSTSGYVNQTPGKFYVPGALGQIELFRIALKGKKPQARALYIIWTGGNDYITGATEPADVVANISKAVETLYSLGARNFLVPNLPDLGMAPLIQPNGQEFSLLTKSHNTLLAKARNEWVARLRGVNIALVDVYAVTQNLFKAGVIVTGPPALELIAGGTGAVSCLFTNPAACPDVNLAAVIPPVYFWDVLHPTTLVHGHYGQAMFNSRP